MPTSPDNATIAERLEAFAALLDLVGRKLLHVPCVPSRGRDDPLDAGADRRARRGRSRPGAARDRPGHRGTAARAGRDRADRGARRARARSAARARRPWAAFSGSTPKRMVEIGRALEISTADEFRTAARAGRLTSVPGIGPQTEQRLLAALDREGKPQPRKRPDAEQGARAARRDRDGARRRGRRRPAPLGRRARASFAVVAPRRTPRAGARRVRGLPQIVAVVEREERRARRRHGRGRARSSWSRPSRLASAPSSLRATGTRAYVEGARRACRTAPDEESALRSARRSVVPARAARGAVPRRAAAPARRSTTSAATSTATRPGRTARRRCSRWRLAARELGHEYLAICDHTPNVRVVPGPRRRRPAPPGRGDRGRQRGARAVPDAARRRGRHPRRRRARPARRRARGARLGAAQPARGPARGRADADARR